MNTSSIHEIIVHVTTKPFDLENKERTARSVLQTGSKVKISLRLRKGELHRLEKGKDRLEQLVSVLGDIAHLETKTPMKKGVLSVVLAPGPSHLIVYSSAHLNLGEPQAEGDELPPHTALLVQKEAEDLGPNF